jgi:CheY-like chemotaxis protein
MKKQGNSGHQILVVDDEPIVSKSIKMLLEHEGHTVFTADNGDEALRIFGTHHFDVVITDYRMHGMNGERLAMRIKQLRPGQPIIMATASIYGLNSPVNPSAVVDFLLSKPFTLQELRTAIAHLLPPKKSKD